MRADCAEGVMLGLACGDALGRPIEFKSSQEIESQYGTLTEMVGNGTWGQPAGTITDDTDQALCIARSVVEQGEFVPSDIARRFVGWYDSGPFDIGIMTRQSIEKLKQDHSWDKAGQEVWEASPEGSNAGNGSVMRCPPLAIAYAADPDDLVTVSRYSSRITHADPRCTYGCAVLNFTIAGYLTDKNEPLARALDRVRPDAPDEVIGALEPLIAGYQPDTLSTSGYVIHTLQTALHDAIRADTAEDAIVTAVNRGGDTDTIGAITGAVAGARFGANELPKRWLDEIDEEQELRQLAADLLDVGAN